MAKRGEGEKEGFVWHVLIALEGNDFVHTVVVIQAPSPPPPMSPEVAIAGSERSKILQTEYSRTDEVSLRKNEFYC